MYSIFSTLEDRVRTLEARIRDHDNRLADVENGQARNAKGTRRAGPNVEPMPDGPGSVVVKIDDIQDPPTDNSMTDGMAISFVDEQDCGFFGENEPLSQLVQTIGSLLLRALFKYCLHATYIPRHDEKKQCCD